MHNQGISARRKKKNDVSPILVGVNSSWWGEVTVQSANLQHTIQCFREEEASATVKKKKKELPYTVISEGRTSGRRRTGRRTMISSRGHPSTTAGGGLLLLMFYGIAALSDLVRSTILFSGVFDLKLFKSPWVL